MVIVAAPSQKVSLDTISDYLGSEAESLLGFNTPKIPKERLHLPGPDFIDRVWALSDRAAQERLPSDRGRRCRSEGAIRFVLPILSCSSAPPQRPKPVNH